VGFKKKRVFFWVGSNYINSGYVQPKLFTEPKIMSVS